MFVRCIVTSIALIGLALSASGAGLASSSVDMVLDADYVPVVSLPLPEFEKPVVEIAGRPAEPLAAELLGITEFPLVDCPRCDETVFLDHTSPLLYLRRLSAVREGALTAEELALPGSESADQGLPLRFVYTIRINPQSVLHPDAGNGSPIVGPSDGSSADGDLAVDESHATPALQLTVALLCGGGVVGMFCLVLAAERTRYHPRNAKPRPDYAPTSHIQSAGPRPPWRCFLTLGVTPGSSLEEIKQAYRERVVAAHPDRGGDVDRFRELTSAFEEAIAYATTYQLMVAEMRRTGAHESNGKSAAQNGRADD